MQAVVRQGVSQNEPRPQTYRPGGARIPSSIAECSKKKLLRYRITVQFIRFRLVSMRVLLTHSSADMYGSDRMAAEAAGALVQGGHDVCVVLPGEGPLGAKMREVGAEVRYVDVPVLRKSSLRPHGFVTLLGELARASPSMWVAIRHVRPDVVYVNTITQPWWLALAWLLRLPSVTHVREAEPQLPRLVATGLMLPLLLSDKIICNSRSTEDEVRRAVPVRADRLQVIYNGKDWSGYELAESPPQDTESPRTLVILVVGRLSPRKGQDVVIRALGDLVSLGVQATVRLAGDVFPGYEWYERDLREMAVSLGVGDRVEFLGFVEDIGPELVRASVAVVPSRIEPFGTVAAESMAASVLTIVAEVQGLTEIVTDRQTGLTFPSEDSGALAIRCLWVMQNPEAVNQIVTAGHESVLRRFTTERYRDHIVTAIESVLIARPTKES